MRRSITDYSGIAFAAHEPRPLRGAPAFRLVVERRLLEESAVSIVADRGPILRKRADTLRGIVVIAWRPRSRRGICERALGLQFARMRRIQSC